MKKLFCLLVGISILVSCGGRQPQIEKIYEDGVEVVLNHLEPYVLSGVPSTLVLEEVLTIDSEKPEVAETGLTGMEWFSVDRDGNIYLMMRNSPENFIYKFDGTGRFLAAFGHQGEGPGEFRRGGDILVDGEDKVIAKDMTKMKFFVFSRDGALLEEVKLGSHLSIVSYLGNKTFLTSRQEIDAEKPVFRNQYYITDGDLSSSREFYTFEFDDARRSVRYVPSGTAIILGASDKNIFIGDSRDGYVIRVFDLSGKLVRKIRKDFRPVPLSDAYKNAVKKSQERRGSAGQEILKKLSFPTHLPPFRYLFADGEDRLYVMTNEHEGERTYLYDIYTKDGVFIGRCRLDNVQLDDFEGVPLHVEPLDAKVRGDRLYCLREKDSGFTELVVYKMIWH